MKRNIHAGHRRGDGLRLEVFTDDELHDIHLATLEVLDRTGVYVGDDQARSVFASSGRRVDRETGVVKIPPLAVEVIAGVGPFRDFLSEDHTMRHMRAQSQPRFIDRRVREEWAARGSSTIYERATEKAREILATHEPLPVADAAREEMRAIIAETEAHLGVG